MLARVSADLERISAMVRWVAEATSTRREPWRFGTALFNDEFPGRYDSNFLRVERRVGTATPVDLAGEADRLLGHLPHEDWPQHLYAKLGFSRVGGSWQFTKQPPKAD